MRSCSRSSSIRTSPTPRSSSVCDTDRAHPLGFDDAWDGDHVVTADDQGPPFTVGARDLGVDEPVLHLLPASGEPVAGSPASYLKPWQVSLDPPPPPLHGALELHGALLEPEAVVLAHGLD